MRRLGAGNGSPLALQTFYLRRDKPPPAGCRFRVNTRGETMCACTCTDAASCSRISRASQRLYRAPARGEQIRGLPGGAEIPRRGGPEQSRKAGNPSERRADVLTITAEQPKPGRISAPRRPGRGRRRRRRRRRRRLLRRRGFTPPRWRRDEFGSTDGVRWRGAGGGRGRARVFVPRWFGFLPLWRSGGIVGKGRERS
jgi:hypothetical protein